MELDDIQIDEVLKLEILLIDIDLSFDELVDLVPVLFEQVLISKG